MSDFPYTSSPAKIQDVFDKIHDVGVPASVNNKWLTSMGFGSSRDRTFIGLLKAIGFLNGSVPSPTWKDYRDKNKRRTVLGKEIYKAYKELFGTYSDAPSRSDDEIRNYFKTHSGKGDEMVRLYVLTFKNLCRLASFDDMPTEQDGTAQPVATPTTARTAGSQVGTVAIGQPVAVNINIQLTLPDSMDVDGYDAFFAAMKKHLIDGGK